MEDDPYNRFKGGIYTPSDYNVPVALNATVGVKFCQDTILLKSFLDQRKIEYTIEDLEETPFGLGLRIKKNDGMD